jgi:non-homologous end joining protein Ku
MKVDEEPLKLATELKQFKDDYNVAMWELIHDVVAEEKPTAKVPDITDALKKSVQQGKGQRVAPVKRGAAAARSSTAKRTGPAGCTGTAKRRSD